jgi:predicted aldo/keto reductase-like oxidoreductase
MVHGLEDPEVTLDRHGHWRRMKDRMIREGKIRFVGFSTHADMPDRIACVANAPKGGWVDAALVACDPKLIRSEPDLDKALEACAKANIGLMAMKTARGLGRAATQPADVAERFKALGLSPHHAMQQAMWSDGRFAAVCTEMPSRREIVENCQNARAFRRPFDAEQWRLLDEGMKGLVRATCPGCDGSCRRAAGTDTDFCSIARYLAYYEEDGKRDEARSLFAELPAERRDWSRADLSAASMACRGGLDFKSILHRAERFLA